MADHFTTDIITIAATLVAWLVTGVIWLAKLEMRVRFMQQTQSECRTLREVNEGTITTDMTQLKILVAQTARDVKWLRRREERNGKKHPEEDDED